MLSSSAALSRTCSAALRLAAAVTAITGKAEERAAASLFSLGGTQTGRGNAAGLEDFEVVAYLAILPPAAPA